MKRNAMSPLIAMVIMLAFIISFLAVILSWTTTYIMHGWETHQTEKIEQACGSVILSLTDFGVCYGKNLDKIKVSIKNAGEGTVIGLNISVGGGMGSYPVRDFENTSVEPNSIFQNHFNHPSSYGMPTEMTVVPIVSFDDRQVHCNMSQLIVDRSKFSVCTD